MPRIDKVTMDGSAMGLRNGLSNPHERTDRSLTACLQRSVVLQYERTIKYFILNTNNVALQIIPSEHSFDFHPINRDIHISTFYFL
jgi:hypothetical protein